MVGDGQARAFCGRSPRASISRVARGVPFGAEQAARAARLYAAIKRPRGREIDLAVAACALHDGAALWTLTPADFRDIPDLALI